MTSPWGADNSKLFQIYFDASADDYECPTIVTDKSHGACGQSRFGCWTCTVVKEDKSLTAQDAKGQTWLQPLLALRTSMFDERNISDNRLPTRRNGQNAVSNEGHNQGNYTPKYRARLLEQLLYAQKEMQKEHPEIELITNQELVAIQVVWHRDLLFEYKVSDIYNRVYEREFEMKKDAEKIQREIDLLKSVCENPLDFDLIQELLIMQKNKALLNRKRGLKDDMERVIEKYIKKATA